jgi:hypothetical protein
LANNKGLLVATKHFQPNFFSRATSTAMHLPSSISNLDLIDTAIAWLVDEDGVDMFGGNGRVGSEVGLVGV